jgi:N-acetylglutamate synthase-like GNAT family acetyltransferase
MVVKILKIDSPNEKATICKTILRNLPNWFGIESFIKKYVDESKTMPFFTAIHNKAAVGFVSMKIHNAYTAEIYVMGILQKYQRQGIGKELIKCCELFCKDNQIEYLTVKTLDESAKIPDYEKTRNFYLLMEFRPLEVFPLIWDKNNPCLLMAKFFK